MARTPDTDPVLSRVAGVGTARGTRVASFLARFALFAAASSCVDQEDGGDTPSPTEEPSSIAEPSGSAGGTGGAAPADGGDSGGAPGAGPTDLGGSSGSSAAGGASALDGGGLPEASPDGGVQSFPECETDEDCEVAADCCECHAIPVGTSVPTCRLDCGGSNACELQGISTVAQCTLGRCTLAASCGIEDVTCDAPAPECPTGQTASVAEDGCWGACVVSTECPRVLDCAACGDAHCVEFVDLGGLKLHCVEPEPQCEVGNLCECLSPCGTYGCSEQDGQIGCYCPFC